MTARRGKKLAVAVVVAVVLSVAAYLARPRPPVVTTSAQPEAQPSYPPAPSSAATIHVEDDHDPDLSNARILWTFSGVA